MQEISDHWRRLSAVIEQAGMSTNYFARYIGLPVAENLYRIKRGLNGISRDVADRIVDKFPNISKGWLLTGEGSMYYNESQKDSQIPYFDKHIEEALSGVAVMPAYYLYMPMLDGCDYAIRYDTDPTSFDENVLLLSAAKKDKLKEGKEYLFLIKKSLSLQKWSAGLRADFGDDDKIFVVRGRLSICKE